MMRTISAAVQPAAAHDLSDPRGRMARLLASSVLTGSTLHSLAAAGMVIAFGASPAWAQCYSGVGGVLNSPFCNTAFNPPRPLRGRDR